MSHHLFPIVLLALAPIASTDRAHSDLGPGRHAVPAITSLNPASVVVGGPALLLTVNGSGFSRNAVVRWNGANRTTTYVSATQLQATIPTTDLSAVGTNQVTVSVPGGQGGVSNASAFTVGNPQPAISSLTPASTMAGAEPFTLTVDGTNFVQGAAIRWNGVTRSATLVSPTRVTAIIPTSLLLPGNAQIAVANPAPGGGPSVTRSLSVIHETPAISTLSPARVTSGAAAFTLVVNGQNFTRSNSVVRWNNAIRPTTFVSRTRLQAAIAAADVANAGAPAVTVSTQFGTATRTSNASTFIVELAPQISVPGTINIAPAPILGEERLTARGSWIMDQSHNVTMDCRTFGQDFVAIGLSGRHGQGVDFASVICARVRADGTVVPGSTTTGVGGDAGTPIPERRCAAGQVLTGLRGTNNPEFHQIRSLRLRCQPMGTGGLAGGTVSTLTAAGTAFSETWGPDACSGGRAVRAIRVQKDIFRAPFLPLLLAPWVISGVQLICEQPRVS